jgi:hypothetical protein
MLIFVLTSFSLPGAAQCCGARITGKVSDAEGAVIPNAKVTIINVATGHSSKVVTNQMGEFQAPPLPLGTYKVKVSCKGFETTETPARTLEIDQVLRFDVTLPIKAKAKNK